LYLPNKASLGMHLRRTQ